MLKNLLCKIFSQIIIEFFYIYSQSSKIIDSKINIGPVADMILSGCPENKAKAPPHTAPANKHSVVAYFINNLILERL